MAKKLDIALARPDPRRRKQSGAPSVRAGFAANDVLTANPKLANSDSYGQGWMVRMKPAVTAGASAGQTPGSAVAAPNGAKIAANAFVGCAT